MSEDRMITMRCPRCDSDAIKIPPLTAPEGYAFDATLTLVRCMDCGAQPSMSDATMVEGEAENG